ncbi:MAG: type IX secretion system PorP/SprF family membrane protein [Flavobacteriales bacterium]|jgi:type IX secretion system PorP/SprF family membrane protein
MRLFIIIWSLLLLTFTTSIAQDAHFTQFYAAPTHLSPAFAGTTVQSRLSTNYRNQWPSIPGAFVAYNVAYDHYAPELKSGFGILATHERAGSGALRSSSVSAQYAYEVRITRQLFFRPALQFTYSNRNINFNDLVFGDQLIRNNDPTSVEENVFQPINFFDMSSGGLFYSPKFWFGAALHHINQPNESLYPDRIGLLPRKVSMHGGYRFKSGSGGHYRKSGNEIVVAFNYKKQGEFSQLDLGAYWEIDPLVLGVWYRGLPVFKSNDYGYANQDAVAILAGIGTNKFRFAYSYDITVSQLSVGASGGAHEISIVYEWANKRNAHLSKRRVVPCAKF